jgi:hypothetical protein
MNDLDRVRFQEMGRECVRRYGSQVEVAEMCARSGEPLPEPRHKPLTNSALLKLQILRAHGHGASVIAKATGLPRSVVRAMIWPKKAKRHELAA